MPGMAHNVQAEHTIAHTSREFTTRCKTAFKLFQRTRELAVTRWEAEHAGEEVVDEVSK